MKVTWGNVQTTRCRRVVLVLIALLLQCSTTFARSYHAIYLPIGVGETPGTKNFTEFGEFHEYFSKCGKRYIQGLSEQFPKTSVDIFVSCEPSPERTIYTYVATDYGSFSRDLKKECELFTCSAKDFEKADQNIKTITNADGKNGDVISPAPPSAAAQICGTKEEQYAMGADSKVLFANEANCFATQPSLEPLIYVTQSNFSQVPRWIKPDEVKVDLRHFYFDGEKLDNMEHSFNPLMFTQKKALGSLKYQECNTACDSGEVVKLTMKDSAYASMIYLKGDCSSFKICAGAADFNLDTEVPTCHPQKTITVLVDSGVIVWPDKRRSSIIELKSPRHDPGRVVAIEFGYTADAQYYFRNDHREYVQSDSKGFNKSEAQRLTFFFPQENCLQPEAGIFSKYIDVGKALTSKSVTKGQTYNQALIPITGPQAEKPSVVEWPAPIENIPHSTTVQPPRAVPGGGAVALSEPLGETNVESKGLFVPGKWWAWGIYVGFIIGTLATLAAGAGAMYLLRRTVFGVWYRGMYKRYGCDVSGTTAGLTGVGFGNTTGDVTAMTGATGATGGATSTSTSLATTPTSAATPASARTTPESTTSTLAM